MSKLDTIEVDTSKIEKKASDLEKKINETKTLITDMERKVKSISYFWEGEAATTHIESFNHRIHDSDQYIQAFLDSVDNLRVALGIYKKADKEVKQKTKHLENDVIS